MRPALQAYKPILLAGFSGLLLAIVTYILYLFSYAYTPVLVLLGWYLVGSFLLAAIPVYLVVRYRLLSPAVIALGFYIILTILAHVHLDHIRGLPMQMYIEFYLSIWPVPLIVSVLAGGFENFIRNTHGRGIDRLDVPAALLSLGLILVLIANHFPILGYSSPLSSCVDGRSIDIVCITGTIPRLAAAILFGIGLIVLIIGGVSILRTQPTILETDG